MAMLIVNPSMINTHEITKETTATTTNIHTLHQEETMKAMEPIAIPTTTVLLAVTSTRINTAIEGEEIIKKEGNMMDIREDKVAITEQTDVITAMMEEKAITETERRTIDTMIKGRLKGNITVVNAATLVIGTGVNGSRMGLKAKVEAIIDKKDAPQNIPRTRTANRKSKFFP